jgi:hypothetical protein
LQIEDLKVEPKVGDYVKARYAGEFFFGIFKGDVSTNRVGTVDGIDTGRFKTYDSIQILTPTQFQSEVNALGFEYNFKNDTFKELKWEPKEGERCFELTAVEIIYNPKYHKKACDDGYIFKTRT